MSGAFKGRDVAMRWNSVLIPGVREKDLTLNGDAIDVTSDDSAGWRELMTVSAMDSVDLKLSGVTKDTTLRADWFGGTRTRPATFTYPDGGVVSGTFFLASYAEKGTYNDAVTFEATVSSSGVVTYTPGS